MNQTHRNRLNRLEDRVSVLWLRAMTDDEFYAIQEFIKTGVLDKDKLKDILGDNSENPDEGEGES